MKISIITVNLNNVNGLEKTIESVHTQINNSYEFIVIDGGSTDNSVVIIENNKDIIHYFVSEPDRGIFDAMNKGLDKATGDFVIFLNSGDIFYDQKVLENVVDNITLLDKVYFGCAKVINRKGTFYLFPKLDSDANTITSFLKYHKPNHQSMFFPKVFYAKNRYDIQYKIAGDEDYKIGAIKSCGYIFLNRIIVSFILGGISSPNTINKLKRIVWEFKSIHKIHEIYKLKYHIRFIISLFLKYIFYKILLNKGYGNE
jgi:glycosyltransferase involved in cell wall biosynthesis